MPPRLVCKMPPRLVCKMRPRLVWKTRPVWGGAVPLDVGARLDAARLAKGAMASHAPSLSITRWPCRAAPGHI